MLKIVERVADGTASRTLTLAYEQRTKGRLRVVLDDGCAAGLFLDRGPILRDGDLLRAEDGSVIAIKAAAETVSVVHSSDPLRLAQVCYHLGNRHKALQILSQQVRYQHDTVLDDMVRKLGLTPEIAELPFEPEPGAYGEHGVDHDGGHSHDH